MKKQHNNTRLICQLSAAAALVLSANAMAADAFSADSKWMTGDWGGERTKLIEQGIDIKADYVGEMGYNAHGGYNDDKTGRYSDQFGLGVALDLQKLWGWDNTQAKIQLTNRNGQNISNDRIGDPRAGTLSSSQEVYGRGHMVRLTQFWIQHQMFDNKLDVKLGYFGEGEDFNTFPCDFQNLSFCGSQVGNYVNTWYNWPVAQAAIRVKYNITPELYAQIGAYNQNPSQLEHGNGFKLSGSGTKGTVIPVELVWSPKVNNLPGEYRVGFYKSAADAPDVREDVNGGDAVLSGADFRTRSSKKGYWFVAQQQLTTHNGDASRGLNIAANATFHDKETNLVDNYQSLMLVYKGPFDARPKDDVGIGVARLHVNDDVKKNSQLLNAANGVSDYDNPLYTPIRETEYNVELNYGFHVTNWLTVRPNLQYVVQPGGVDKVDNALVAGLKIQSTF
ncbi:Carbohydrate-selective porin OprB [Pseudomonas synxantha]|uniref:Porin n=4 Tax=Pseudomonas TaxID=286 RepID=A0A0R2YAH8_9PSED|nr:MULTISPECIES: carbohydrate porin [Pseudomonas]AKA82242.1 Glucose-selective porin OprB [Pseudomonas synxantha]AMS23449.1 porin [Pseudomonas synxantha]AZE62953.1 Carbohydrate-selective porin OprB [Pseudomonas synxantha]AZE74618.1 Carbohydrate-selective porin OprB [Pseudomonas synxantha]AZE80219.1 Carbohydrate-selective porin OprB [Pseudomonas synxantha]